MEVKNQTTITGEELNLLSQSTLPKINSKLCLVNIVVFGVITLAIMIMNIVFEMESVKLIYIFIPAIALGLSIGLYVLSKKGFSSKVNSNFCDGVRYNYVFKDEYFEVDAQLSGQASHSSIMYSSLYDVQDKGYCVMIFISKSQFFACKYDGFQQEEKDECLNKLFLFQRKKNN